MYRRLGVMLTATAMVAAAACGGGAPADTSGGGTTAGAPAAPPAAAMTAAPPAAVPATVADIFPPGAAREQVLNNCASCHNVACAAIGQRSVDRWNALKASHRDNVANANLDAIFGYLNEHFGADKPQPQVPPAFLEGGCTPF